MPLLASDIWRDFETAGVPASGAHKPIKADIRAWGSALENAGGITAPGVQLVPLFSNGVGVPAAYRPIVGNDLPNPSLAVPGAVYAKPAAGNQLLAGLGTDGEFDTVDTSALVISSLTAPVKVNGLNFLNSVGGTHSIVGPDGRDAFAASGAPGTNFYKAATHEWYDVLGAQRWARLTQTGLELMPQPATVGNFAAPNALTISQTWNGAGQNIAAVRLAITDTASSVGSQFIRASTAAGGLKWYVDKNGSGTYAGNLNIGGVLVVGTANFASYNGASFDLNQPIAAGTRWLTQDGSKILEILRHSGVREYYGATAGFHSVSAPPVASGNSTWPTTSGELLNTGRMVNFKIAVPGVNVNAVGDTAITIPMPPGVDKWRVSAIQALNVGVTASLTNAQYGLFSAGSGGGIAYTAAGAPLAPLIANVPNTPGHMMQIALGTLPTYVWNSSITIFFRCTQAQGAAATIDLMLNIDTFY